MDKEIFARMQELQKNKRRPTRTGRANLFSEIVRCADCGAKMYLPDKLRKEKAA